jgi:redox-sensing transcriptional repressor
MFDVDESLVGTKIYGIPVYHLSKLSEFARKENITIGVLTVPKEAAYEVSELMIEGGIRGIWNFANMELKLDNPDVIVENIHLGDSLMKLCYELKSNGAESDENE